MNISGENLIQRVHIKSFIVKVRAAGKVFFPPPSIKFNFCFCVASAAVYIIWLWFVSTYLPIYLPLSIYLSIYLQIYVV